MINVLLIAYVIDDTHQVGAKRARYWAEQLSVVDPEVRCTVITADRDILIPGATVHSVPHTRRGAVLPLTRDAGMTWKHDIIAFFRKSGVLETADVVIMTGSPFMHFSLARHIKERSRAGVILDFRDPFARHPHFGRQVVRGFVKSLYERQFIRYADQVITVNRTCADMLHPAAHRKTVIIENGYDEMIVDAVDVIPFDREKIHLVYAGSFYPTGDRMREDRDPAPLIAALEDINLRDRAVFHHVGPMSDLLPEPSRIDAFRVHGPKNYRGMIEVIKSADLGIIFTSGRDFETTTKVFDYIGCDKPVLVVTNGAVRSGELHETTRGLDQVYWVANDRAAIAAFLRSFERPREGPLRPQRERFSRRKGLLHLIELFRERSV